MQSLEIMVLTLEIVNGTKELLIMNKQTFTVQFMKKKKKTAHIIIALF